jgi:pimeloyl-ACP methyl ester carboxylesterase
MAAADEPGGAGTEEFEALRLETPRGLYPRLGGELPARGIAGLQMRFRDPTVLEEAVYDVLVGLAFQRVEGKTRVALAGHSFGGAVVIQAAALAPEVRTVVTLATQAYGADPVSRLGPRCSILRLHGTHDRILAPLNSEHVHQHAGEPRRIVLFPGADHGLDEAADEVHALVHGWIVGALG